MPNALNEVMPKLLAQGLQTLRQNAVMPRLAFRRYEALAGERGSVVEVPIPAAVPARDVAPGVVPPASQDIKPGKTIIPLNFWKEAPFYLTDKDRLEVMDGVIPMQAAEAVKSVCNAVDVYLIEQAYKMSFSHAGTAGTTPFAADTGAYDTVRRMLNSENIAVGDRHVVLDPFAESNVTKLSDFRQADRRGDQQGILENEIGRKLGASWWMDQNMPFHTRGTAPAGAVTVSGAQAVGAGSASYADGSGTLLVAIAAGANGQAKAGDLFTVAGQTQQYVVLDDIALNGASTALLHIFPALRTAVAGAEAVSIVASHRVNLFLQRNSLALASRPLQSVDDGLGARILSAVDEVTGLILRLEVTRQHKQTQFSFDILCGAKAIRPEGIARILG